MRFPVACVAAAALLTGMAITPVGADQAEGVAAIVNDEVVSTYDVKQRAILLLAGSGIEPTEEVLERARAQALRDLVDERLQIQEAKERKIVVDASDIDRAVADLARQNGSNMDGLSQQLTAIGVNVTTLRQQIEADIAWRRLVNQRYSGRVRISEGQVRDTQARVTANAAKPQYLVSEIFIPAESASELKQANEIADKLLSEIRQGAPFPAVARQFSASPTAAAGGDMGWLAQGELKGELQTVVDQLQPGQASRPVRGPGGVYILALREKRAGVDPATLSRVALQQVSAPAGSRSELERQARRLQSCAGVERLVASVPGASVTDLGEVSEAELSDDVRKRISDVPIGGASSVSASGDAVAAFVVCNRASVGEGIPSLEQVQNRLYEQELTMLAQRYLRNLRRDSTIITR